MKTRNTRRFSDIDFSPGFLPNLTLTSLETSRLEKTTKCLQNFVSKSF